MESQTSVPVAHSSQTTVSPHVYRPSEQEADVSAALEPAGRVPKRAVSPSAAAPASKRSAWGASFRSESQQEIKEQLAKSVHSASAAQGKEPARAAEYVKDDGAYPGSESEEREDPVSSSDERIDPASREVPARAAEGPAQAAAAMQVSEPSRVERELLSASLIEAIQDIEKKAGKYLKEGTKLTEDQYVALKRMLEEPKMIVGLKPGQGKTIVMIVASLILAEAYKGKDVYLIVQNKNKKGAGDRFKTDAKKWLKEAYAEKIGGTGKEDVGIRIETHVTIKKLEDNGNLKKSSICIVDEPHLKKCRIPKVDHLKVVTASWATKKCCAAVLDEELCPKDSKKDEKIENEIYSEIVTKNELVVRSEQRIERECKHTTCEYVALSEEDERWFKQLKSDLDNICEALKKAKRTQKMQIAHVHNLFEYILNMFMLKKTLESMKESSPQTLIVLKRVKADKQKENFTTEITQLSDAVEDEALKEKIARMTKTVEEFFSKNTPEALVASYNTNKQEGQAECNVAIKMDNPVENWKAGKSLVACSSIITGVHGLNYAHTDEKWEGPRPELKLIGNFTEEEEEQAIGRLDRKDNIEGVEVKVAKMRIELQDKGERLYAGKETPKLAQLLVENEEFKKELNKIVGEEVLSEYQTRYFSNKDFEGFHARIKYHEKSGEIYELIERCLNEADVSGEGTEACTPRYSYYAGSEIRIREGGEYVYMESPYIWSRLEHKNSYGKVIKKLCELHKSQIGNDPICEKLNKKSTGLVLTKEGYKYVRMYEDVMDALLSIPLAAINPMRIGKKARIERVENLEKSEEERVKMRARKLDIRGSRGGATGSDEVEGRQSKRARHSPEEAVETPEEEQETQERRESSKVLREKLMEIIRSSESSLTEDLVEHVTRYADNPADCRELLARAMPGFKMNLKGDEVWIEGTLSSVLIAKKVDIETFRAIMGPQFRQRLLDPLTDVTTRDPGVKGAAKKSYLKGYSLMQLAVYLNDEKGLGYLRYILETVTGENNYVLEHKTTEDDESTVLHMAVENLIEKRKEEKKIENVEGPKGFKPFALKCRSDYEGACHGINERLKTYCDTVYSFLAESEMNGDRLLLKQTEAGIHIGYTDSQYSVISLSREMRPGTNDPSFLSKRTSMGEYKHKGRMYLKIS